MKDNEEKTKQYLIKKLYYYISHMNPGGIEPFTFWEKAKIVSFVGFLIFISAMMFFLISFVPR